jgi:hypothetical protein
LVRVIALDYDVTKSAELETVREQLDILRVTAVAEDDATLFDASGTSGAQARSLEHTPTLSSEAESTSITTGVTALSLGSTSGSSSPPEGSSTTLNEYDGLSNDAKATMLKDLFPTLKARDVEVTLKKCSYDISRTTDVLLNQVFFDSSYVDEDGDGPIRARGIDAFSEDYSYISSGKRGKGKKKGKKFRSVDDDDFTSSSASPNPPTATNAWSTANEDITFIASRLQWPKSGVSSVYHANGASRRKTIKAIIDEHLRTEKHEVDLQVSAYAADLVEEFPGLSMAQGAALIRLAKMSTANAHELAKALTASTTRSTGLSPEDLLPQYAPLKLSQPAPANPRTTSGTSTPSGSTAALSAARATAFENASRYHRLGKSDKLMGGATAYYSSIGRSLTTALHTASSTEADLLVSSQSTSSHIDLHGVTVKEAVRIASERTDAWWEELGEKRVAGGGRAIGEGLVIVTGVGRHSEGGQAKLGPAVGRRLIGEGWRVEVGRGELVVRGRMR